MVNDLLYRNWLENLRVAGTSGQAGRVVGSLGESSRHEFQGIQEIEKPPASGVLGCHIPGLALRLTYLKMTLVQDRPASVGLFIPPHLLIMKVFKFVKNVER